MKVRKSDVGRFAKVSRFSNPKKIFQAIIVDENEFNNEMFDVFDMERKKVIQIHIDQVISLEAKVKYLTK